MSNEGKQIRELDKTTITQNTDYLVLQRVNSSETIGFTYKITYTDLMSQLLTKDFSSYSDAFPTLLLTDHLIINRYKSSISANETFKITSANLLDFVTDLSLVGFNPKSDLSNTDWFYVYAENEISNKKAKISYTTVVTLLTQDIPHLAPGDIIDGGTF